MKTSIVVLLFITVCNVFTVQANPGWLEKNRHECHCCEQEIDGGKPVTYMWHIERAIGQQKKLNKLEPKKQVHRDKGHHHRIFISKFINSVMHCRDIHIQKALEMAEKDLKEKGPEPLSVNPNSKVQNAKEFAKAYAEFDKKADFKNYLWD